MAGQMRKRHRPGLDRDGSRQTIRAIYDRLWRAHGPQHWWPAKTATEVAIGAILTQNTAWTNVERAIENLRRAGCLSFRELRDLPEDKLAELIRPAGTYRVKAARLKAFVDCLWKHHHGSLEEMLAGDRGEEKGSAMGRCKDHLCPTALGTSALRKRLLAVHGVGPETADAILLYAGSRPTFVVDAYTRRILRRHLVIDDRADYGAVQGLFHQALPRDPQLYNEYHALLVAVGKSNCRPTARCVGCPLTDLPHDEAL